MALYTKAVTITSPTSTGSVTYADLCDFTPKIVIAVFEKQIATGSGTDFIHCTGFATSSASRRAVGAVYLDGVSGGTVNMARFQSNAHLIYAYNTTAVAVSAFLVGDMTGFVYGGLTINWSTVQASGYLVSLLLIGGADITNTFIKDVQAPAATGSQSYTGVGFKPDALITISNSDTSAGPTQSHNSGARVNIGYATGTTSKSSSSASDETAGKFHGKAQKTAIALAVDAVGSAILFEATHTSMDADGFTWNWVTTSVNRYTFVLCIKGGQYKVGAFDQSTSTGKQTISDIGFIPKAILLSSVNAVTSTSMSSGAKLTLGCFTSPTSRWTTWLGSSGDPTIVDHYHDTANALQMLTEGTPTVVTTADANDLGYGYFSINNTAVDATSREVVYFAFGETASNGISKVRLRPKIFAPGVAR